MKIGYARVSTTEQNLDLQLDALNTAGCTRIYEERASGKNAKRTKLANCVIYYNACLLSELLEYAEHEKDFERAERIKRISPVSWKHVNFYGQYTFRDIGDVIDLEQIINRWVALRRDRAKKTEF